MLTPVVLMLPMFFTTFHTLSATIVLRTNLYTLHAERYFWYAWKQNIVVSLTPTVLVYKVRICIPYVQYSNIIMSTIQSIAAFTARNIQ